MTPPDPPTVTVRHVLSATPEVVYDQWLDPEALADWMCPRPARLVRVELDPSVGGGYRFEVEDQGMELTVTGTYLELDPPARLRFSWNCTAWTPPAADSEVTVTLEPHGDGDTLMTIVHTLLPEQVVDDHRRGWTRIGGQLEAALRS